MQLFRLFGEVALRGGGAVVSGLKRVERQAQKADEAVEDLKDEMNRLPRKTDVVIDVDTSGAMGAIMALGPALIPVLSSIGLAAGGIGAAFAAAGAGAAAFGAIAVPALGKIFEASEEVAKIEEKIAKADTWKEKKKAMKELDALYASMNAKQREALKALQSFKSFWSDFVGGLQNPVLDMFITGLDTLKTTLTGLKPVFQNAITAVADVFARMNEAAKSQRMQEFFNWLAVNVGPAIRSFGEAFMNIMSGVISLMMAFGPVSTDMQNGLVGLTQRFAEWAAGLSESQAFKDFIAYAQANGPKVMALLSELATTLVELVKAMAPMGPIVLDAVTGFLQMVNYLLQLHPAVGITLVSIIQLIGALKLVGAGANAFLNLKNTISQVGIVMKTVGTWLKPLMTGFQMLGPAVLRLATLLRGGLVGAFRAVITVLNILRVAFLTNPFGLIVTAVVAAVALIIMHWDKVKAFLLKTWNAIKSTATTVWNAITAFFKKWGPTILSVLTGPIGALVIYLIRNWDQVKAKTQAVWNAIKSALSSAWSSIKSTVSSAINGVKNTISSIWNSIKSATSSAWNSIKSTISKGISSAWSTVKGYASRFLSAGKGLLDALARGIKQGISRAISAVKSGMAKIRSYLPFSPAKEGPLSDLDKSGESFFPTWAEGVEKGTAGAVRAVSAGMARARQMLGGPEVAGLNTAQAASLAGMAAGPVIITGNTFNIREESDIEKVSRSLYKKTRERQRGPGVVRV